MQTRCNAWAKGEAWGAAADWKGAAAAYERASSEAPAPTLDLVEGLAGALLADARPQRAVEVRSGLRVGRLFPARAIRTEGSANLA